MKIKTLFTILLSGSIGIVSAQTTVTFQPGPADGVDASVVSDFPTTNYGIRDRLSTEAWTNGGNPFTVRSLLAFDLTVIPLNAIITDARLSLANLPGNDHVGSNASYLQKVTSPWDEHSVTWNTQPTTVTIGQITLAQSSYVTEDYPNIDVKNFVQDMVADPSTNYGWMLKLVTESPYSGLVLTSSDYLADSLKRPKLEVTYVLPCDTFQPDSSNGIDASVVSDLPTTNYGIRDRLSTEAWTTGGNPFTVRSLLKFDLTSIPSAAVVADARLSLSNLPGNDHVGSNASYLQKVTSTWGEHSVTWNTQPTTVTTGQITLPQSSYVTEDYPNIDVKNFVQDMVVDPSTNYGWMIRLVTESPYRGLVFASSDYGTPLKRPKLKVCYAVYYTDSLGKRGITMVKNKNDEKIDLQVYPNPSQGSVTIEFSNHATASVSYKVFNIKGELIESADKGILPAGNQSFEMMNTPADKGVYIIHLNIAGSIYYKKLIKI